MIILCLLLLFSSSFAGTVTTEVEGLYGTIFVDNQDFSLNLKTSIREQTSNQNICSSLDINTLNLKWEGGVKGAIGYSPCGDGNTFKILVTYLPNTQKTYLHKEPIVEDSLLNYFIPLLNPSIVGNIADTINIYSKVNFITLDFLAETTINTNSKVLLFPFIGVRALFLNKTFSARFDNNLYLSNSRALVEPFAKSELHDKNRSAGITAGFAFSNPLFSRLSLFGKIGGSVLVGSVKIEEQNFGSEVAQGARTLILNPLNLHINQRKNVWNGNLEGELGLSYAFNICGLQTETGVSYFNALWFDQNRLRNIYYTNDSAGNSPFSYASLPPTYGNLGIQAVAFKLKSTF